MRRSRFEGNRCEEHRTTVVVVSRRDARAWSGNHRARASIALSTVEASDARSHRPSVGDPIGGVTDRPIRGLTDRPTEGATDRPTIAESLECDGSYSTVLVIRAPSIDRTIDRSIDRS